MALPDIKGVGILAGFTLWGWPWHGLCTSGVIAAAGGNTKTIPTPTHGSAWLYDLGLPAIVRTPDEVAADTALGHEWRNYAMISGGVVYGTQLGADKFIHVDEDGKRWLVSLAFSFPNESSQQVRVTLSIIEFGRFELVTDPPADPPTPVVIVEDVQCTYFTYASYGYTYSISSALLEDVWTNGSRVLVSVSRVAYSSPGVPSVRDIFSLVELSITGKGGADGSGLVVSSVEVMKDVELSQGQPSNDSAFSFPSQTGDISYTCGSPEITVAWGTPGRYWDPDASLEYDNNNFDTYTYARYAYYNSAGAPKAARIKKEYHGKMSYITTAYSESGSVIYSDTLCPGSSGFQWVTNAACYATTTCQKEYEFGIYLLENDVEIDSLKLHQVATITQEFALHDAPYAGYGYPVCGDYITCDIWDGTGWATKLPAPRTLYQKSETVSWSAPSWGGSLASSLSLPPPPDMSTGGWSRSSLPLNVDAVADAWRSASNTSGYGSITGSVDLGIQRIEAKAAAFFKPGTTREYGSVLTPSGIKSTSLTPTGDLYFAWQRKTGDFSFSTSPICYV